METLTASSDNYPDWNQLAKNGYVTRLRMLAEACGDLTMLMLNLYNSGDTDKMVRLYHRVLRSDPALLDFYTEWLATQPNSNPRDWRNCLRHQIRMSATLAK